MVLKESLYLLKDELVEWKVTCADGRAPYLIACSIVARTRDRRSAVTETPPLPLLCATPI